MIRAVLFQIKSIQKSYYLRGKLPRKFLDVDFWLLKAQTNCQTNYHDYSFSDSKHWVPHDMAVVHSGLYTWPVHPRSKDTI